MTNEKEYFTENEAIGDIIVTLKDGFSGCYSELHHEVFNSDYYIIGSFEARQALIQYDVFKAIGEIVEYEKDVFGSVSTDITSPEKVANMLYYIVGDNAMTNLNEALEVAEDELGEYNLIDDEATDEVNEILIRELEKQFDDTI